MMGLIPESAEEAKKIKANAIQALREYGPNARVRLWEPLNPRAAASDTISSYERSALSVLLDVLKREEEQKETPTFEINTGLGSVKVFRYSGTPVEVSRFLSEMARLVENAPGAVQWKKI